MAESAAISLTTADHDLFGDNAFIRVDTTANQHLLVRFQRHRVFRQQHGFVTQIQFVATLRMDISLQQDASASPESCGSGVQRTFPRLQLLAIPLTANQNFLPDVHGPGQRGK